MLDHYGIPCGDVDASVAFYLRVFGPLGFSEAMRFPDGRGGSVVGLVFLRDPDGHNVEAVHHGAPG